MISFWLFAITVLLTAQVYPPLEIFLRSILSRFHNLLALDAYKGRILNFDPSVGNNLKKNRSLKTHNRRKSTNRQSTLHSIRNTRPNNSKNSQTTRSQNQNERKWQDLAKQRARTPKCENSPTSCA